jgi:putative hydrolase of the HAD superfamily
MPIRALLCDVDGIVRFYDHGTLAASEQRHGLAAGAVATYAFDPVLLAELTTGALTHAAWRAETVRRLEQAFGPAVDGAALVGAFVEAPQSVDRRVLGLLARVRTSMAVLLVTNGADVTATELADLGVLEHVDGLVNSAEVGVAKPDPEIYRVAAARAGGPVESCLFVDDREANVIAARELGMTGVVYRTFDDLAAAVDAIH